jgi:putative ABC transport system permease protein
VRPGKAFQLSVRSLSRHRARTGLLISGIVVGVAFLVLLLAFVEGMRGALVERLVGTLPVTHLQVTTRQYALGALQIDNPFADLDSTTVARIEALSGVEGVLPMAALAAPAQLRASFFGQGFVTDAGVFGIEPELLGEDLKPELNFARRSSGPVPTFISSDLVDMYNTGFAASNNLPKLNERILLNQDATLVIGTSSFSPAAIGASVDRVPLQIVGASGRVPLAGISVPIEYVREWNRRFAGEEAAGTYASLTVIATDAQAVEPLSRELEAQGLQVNTGREIAEKVAAIARYLSLAFGMIGFVILLVAGLGIANALALSVLERQREIGIFRSVGASQGNIRTIFLLEAFLLGAAGSALGIALALALEVLANRLLLQALQPSAAGTPASLLIPSSFFANTWQILGTAFIIGLVVSLLAGVSPASRAARLQPAEVLKGA